MSKDTNTEAVRLSSVRGHVLAKWVKDAGSLPAYDIHNTLSFTAADVMAEAYGGDTSRVPKYMGFIYGPGVNGSPDAMTPVTRFQSMDTIRGMVESIGGNMQVVRFNRRPTVCTYDEFGYDDSTDSTDSTDSNDRGPYFGNVVEFHAVTRSGRDGVYVGQTSSGTPYADEFSDGDILYRAVLLGDSRNPCEGDPYVVLAMVDLKKDGTYRKKPAGYELSVDWRVAFE